MIRLSFTSWIAVVVVVFAPSAFAIPCTLSSECDDANACTDDRCTDDACEFSPNSAACEDGDLCTVNDRCVDGACAAGDPVVCGPIDACHDAGVCRPETGLCSHPTIGPDFDADGVPDACDNCPVTANSGQSDRGYVSADTSRPATGDGIGDACQCGDVNRDGWVDGQDESLYRAWLVSDASTSAGDLGIDLDRCATHVDPDSCDLLDGSIVARALRAPLSPPGIAPVCRAAVEPGVAPSQSLRHAVDHLHVLDANHLGDLVADAHEPIDLSGVDPGTRPPTLGSQDLPAGTSPQHVAARFDGELEGSCASSSTDGLDGIVRVGAADWWIMAWIKADLSTSGGILFGIGSDRSFDWSLLLGGGSSGGSSDGSSSQDDAYGAVGSAVAGGAALFDGAFGDGDASSFFDGSAKGFFEWLSEALASGLFSGLSEALTSFIEGIGGGDWDLRWSAIDRNGVWSLNRGARALFRSAPGLVGVEQWHHFAIHGGAFGVEAYLDGVDVCPEASEDGAVACERSPIALPDGQVRLMCSTSPGYFMRGLAHEFVIDGYDGGAPLDEVALRRIILHGIDGNADCEARKAAYGAGFSEDCATFAQAGSGSPPDSAIRFTEVSLAAGIDYVQYSGDTDPTTDIFQISGGAAVGDFDGDGWSDLYVTRLDANDLLYRNRGDGTFEDVTVASGIVQGDFSNGAVWGDIDNDGDLDLYVTSMYGDEGTGRNHLYINDGEGHFVEEAVTRGTGAPVSMGQSATFGDYDRDGWLDLHTNGWAMVAESRLLRNRGSAAPGHFEDVTQSAGVSFAPWQGGVNTFGFTSSFSDLNDDGWPDLAVAADFHTSHLFWNEGDGSFRPAPASAGIGTDENGMGSAIGDVDGDGDLDWFVTSIYTESCQADPTPCTTYGIGYTGNRLYLNDGDETFTDATSAAGVRVGNWGWGAAFFDADNDGDLDLGMTNGYRFIGLDADVYRVDPVYLWRNDGARFKEVSIHSGMVDRGEGRSFVQLDYDRDGDLDIFVANYSGRPKLFRNDTRNTNAWLRLDVRGTISNRDGSGARVVLESRGRRQLREVRLGGTFLGQNEKTLHFGLGAMRPGELVEKIEIRWPTGEVQTLEDVAPNQVVLAVEPGGG